ncbi:MAG: hypothetical protein JO362_16915, partial [Streptomycetaceae bacterium]|nr:hypothetical protein [Streptomycetaceae bacterium]
MGRVWRLFRQDSSAESPEPPTAFPYERLAVQADEFTQAAGHRSMEQRRGLSVVAVRTL